VNLARYRSGSDTAVGSSSTTLFWVPEAGVVPHLVAMEILARTLRDEGHAVAMVRCHAIFNRCPVKQMLAIPDMTPRDSAAARRCCDRCLDVSLRLEGRYDLPTVNLGAVDRRVALRTSAMLGAKPRIIGTHVVDDVPFGTLALHDVALAHKIADVSRPPDSLLDTWWERVEDCVRSFLLADELVSGGNVSTLVTFSDTAFHVCARLAAERRGVACRSASFASHRNVDRRRIVVSNEIPHEATLHQAAAWPEWRDLALLPETVVEVCNDLVRHFTNSGNASHIYSKGMQLEPAALCRRLGLDMDRRTLVAYTSSLDEINATRAFQRALGVDTAILGTPTFDSQVSWLRSVARYAADRPDLQLVIRIHPREDANVREGRTSEHLGILRDGLAGLPDSTTVVWPRDDVSSYDLSRIARAALVWESSIGLELARAGVPVLAVAVGATHNLPRGDGVSWAPSPDAYFSTLDDLILRNGDIAAVVHAFRWYAMMNLGGSLDVADLVPVPDSRRLPRWRRPVRSSEIVDAIVNGNSPDRINLRHLRDAQHGSSADDELTAVRGQLARLFDLVMTGADTGSPGRMDGVGLEGELVTIERSGEVHRDWAPLGARLARLATGR